MIIKLLLIASIFFLRATLVGQVYIPPTEPAKSRIPKGSKSARPKNVPKKKKGTKKEGTLSSATPVEDLKKASMVSVEDLRIQKKKVEDGQKAKELDDAVRQNSLLRTTIALQN